MKAFSGKLGEGLLKKARHRQWCSRRDAKSQQDGTRRSQRSVSPFLPGGRQEHIKQQFGEDGEAVCREHKALIMATIDSEVNRRG